MKIERMFTFNLVVSLRHFLENRQKEKGVNNNKKINKLINVNYIYLILVELEIISKEQLVV